jgi:hypothetical protein
LTLVAALAFGFDGAPSYAGPCSAEIAEIETAMAESDPRVGLTDPKSTDAQAHTPPTPHSAARADMKADARYIETMDRARLLDAQNSPACMKVVRKIRNLIGMAAQ